MKKLPSFMRLQFFFPILALSTLGFSFSLTAQQEISLVHQQVIDAAENYVESELEMFSQGNLRVKAMPIDKRIKIPACDSDYIMSASDEALRQSNVTVKASCPTNNWYLYLVVKAAEMHPVVVLNTMASPGTLLTSENTDIIEVDKKKLRSSTYADKESVLGARLKRRTRAGQPVLPGQLCFVCKGDQVQITAELAGLTIKTRGVAQQDGNVGDTIKVLNSRSKKQVLGKVASPNQITVQI